MRWVLIAAALVGCGGGGGEPEPTRWTAMLVWDGEGTCDEDVSRLTVLEVSAYTAKRICGTDANPDRLRGCFISAAEDGPTIALVYGWDARVMAHELAHWLRWCSGKPAGHDDEFWALVDDILAVSK